MIRTLIPPMRLYLLLSLLLAGLTAYSQSPDKPSSPTQDKDTYLRELAEEKGVDAEWLKTVADQIEQREYFFRFLDTEQSWIGLSPNPVASGNNLQLKLESPVEQTMTLHILGMNGQRLQTQTLLVPAGITVQDISPGQLPAGIYFLQLSLHDKLIKKKFVV